MKTYRTFNSILQELLQQKGWTKKEFSELVGISQKQVKAWLLGKHKPRVASLIKIAKSCKVSANYLLGID